MQNQKFQEKVTLEHEIVLDVSAEIMGRDLGITICGGDKPHVGCVALAVPRESLTGDGSISATVSVINVTGHKDDAIGTEVARLVSAACNCVVTVSCGIHFDHISSEQMNMIANCPRKIVGRVVGWRNSFCRESGQ